MRIVRDFPHSGGKLKREIYCCAPKEQLIHVKIVVGSRNMIVFHVLNMYVYVHNALLLNQMNMYLVGKNSRVFLQYVL